MSRTGVDSPDRSTGRRHLSPGAGGQSAAGLAFAGRSGGQE